MNNKAIIAGGSLGGLMTGIALKAIGVNLLIINLMKGAGLKAEAADIEEARKIEAREGKGLARTWEGWKQKAMGTKAPASAAK